MDVFITALSEAAFLIGEGEKGGKLDNKTGFLQTAEKHRASWVDSSYRLYYLIKDFVYSSTIVLNSVSIN